ncbi:MAG: hypothetical protein JNK49_00745 [Planctomycetes bacterium]|nr:hypothetical protein [Planctomycetota bacterium]
MDPFEPTDGAPNRPSSAEAAAAARFAARCPDAATWLLPANQTTPEISADFVARTLARIAADAAEPVSGAPVDIPDPIIPDPILTSTRLAAFAAPPPSPTFVERTVRAIAADQRQQLQAQRQRLQAQRQRLQALLAKYVAPEPSPTFVAQTLAALAQAPAAPATPRRVVAWRTLSRAVPPLLALAAGTWLLLAIRPTTSPATGHHTAVAPAFAHHRDEGPLAAALGGLVAADDPDALPAGAPDGPWLLQQRERR